jgi:hypothetical protein
MKVAIIGEKKRALAWEKHVRKLSVVNEVVLSTSLFNDSGLDAVILLDDSQENLNRLLDAIRAGQHSYLVSRIPLHQEKLEIIHSSSQEAGVHVQFSHWPSIAPSTQWIHQQLDKPGLIQVKKEIEPVNFKVDTEEFEHHWTDEVAYFTKWLGGNVHRMDVKPVTISGLTLGLNLTLRFEDASVASLQLSSFGKSDIHQRIISNRTAMIDNDIIKQSVRVFRVNEQNRISIQKKQFDPADTAEWSVMQFFKSIQMNKSTIFTPYDALLTSRITDKIKEQINKW